jgi:hypothetical protein
MGRKRRLGDGKKGRKSEQFTHILSRPSRRYHVSILLILDIDRIEKKGRGDAGGICSG